MDEFGLQKKDKFLSLLHANKINTEKTSDLKAFFTKIQDHINKLPVLSLTVAFEPKEKTLAAIAEWFMLNLKKQMLFEITVEQDVIAGTKINYKGKFLDASVKPIFDKMLTDILNPSKAEKPTEPTSEKPKQELKAQSATQ
jgi:F0F1-type ATP synthase delta subunit